MAMDTTFADVLRLLMKRAGDFTPGLLSRLARVPKTTIVHWLEGRVKRPRIWQDLVRVAEALRLNEADLTLLLRSAGHPPVSDLLAQTLNPKDQALLASWAGGGRPSALAPPASASVPLPPLVFRLLGRENELAAARRLIEDEGVRLVTLTGPGGVGKTRLALELASELRHSFAGGVFWLALDSIERPAAVLPAIAQVLQLKGTPPAPLAEALGSRHLLLVLDTFEGVVAAAPDISALLHALPQLTLLVTSRVALGLPDERVLVVPPLSFPLLDALPPIEQLARYAAIALFVQRVGMVRPDFALTATNAADIAGLCARLDGLPLAIELAAARSKVLSPHELRDWFSPATNGRALRLLVGGPHNLPARQRTLRASLDWSCRLLSSDAMHLLRCLSAFESSCTLEEATAAWSDGDDMIPVPARVRAAIAVLLGHHLLREERVDGATPRYSMLATTREYALEHLAQSGEEAQTHGAQP